MKNVKMRGALSLMLLALVWQQVAAQAVVKFDKGLASGSSHRYGRDASYTDTLAYLLTNGSLSTPAPEKEWYASGGVQKKWTPVTADSAGLFRDRQMSNGYLYLTYHAPKAGTALLTISGHSMAYFNGEAHAGDQYRYGWMTVPVVLKKGLNELYIRSGFSGRGGGIMARLELGTKALRLSSADSTVPFLVKGQSKDYLWAGVVAMNSTAAAQKGLQIEASALGKTLVTDLPLLHSMGTRKVPVKLPVPDAIPDAGQVAYTLRLLQGGKALDATTLMIDAVLPHQHQSHTFVSAIDGSVQYYSIAPQAGGPTVNPALFLSVHGAEVQAINQARAYKPKAEGTLVAPTNRRPRGFNWEDWGRLDALEVLDIAKAQYKPDPQKIYLTGHSMGGHGTWFLGATYAGSWAGIAPCAGYPVLQSYGSADGLIPTSAATPLQAMLLRASNPSNVLELAHNYKAAGVYVHHGDDDRVVSVNYARQMRKVLADFHPNFAYYEYPGGSHWFGDISVDWPPLFDYFKHNATPAAPDVIAIDFSTANPAISGKHHWLHIQQQLKSFAYSRVQAQADTAKNELHITTENVGAFAVNFAPFAEGTRLRIHVDKGAPFELTISRTLHQQHFVQNNGKWQLANAGPSLAQKGLQRGAGLKEAFNHRMIFIYGTQGTPQENAWALQKARYDAESWYYRGNGAVDVIPDTEYTEALGRSGRGIILYGNATTNSAYAPLLAGCPVQLSRGKALVGSKEYTGDAVGAYFVWPNAANTQTAVAVIGGTGLPGMRAADANQYFAGGSGFPDFMLFDAQMPLLGVKALKAAGYYAQDWSLGSDWVAE